MQSNVMETVFARPKEVEYPAADGQPMAETGFHVTTLTHLFSMLRTFFARYLDVYVGANMFMYYEEGEPNKKVAPDVFVAFDVPSHERRSWFVWQEGKAPDVVFELTSRGTRGEDQGTKKGLYEWLGVQEYFLFDPLNEYLRPRLQGFRLVKGLYQPLSLEDGQLVSERLGLRLKAREHLLDLYDLRTGARLLPPSEMMDEIAQLREELARLRGR